MMRSSRWIRLVQHTFLRLLLSSYVPGTGPRVGPTCRFLQPCKRHPPKKALDMPYIQVYQCTIPSFASHAVWSVRSMLAGSAEEQWEAGVACRERRHRPSSDPPPIPSTCARLPSLRLWCEWPVEATLRPLRTPPPRPAPTLALCSLGFHRSRQRYRLPPGCPRACPIQGWRGQRPPLVRRRLRCRSLGNLGRSRWKQSRGLPPDHRPGHRRARSRGHPGRSPGVRELPSRRGHPTRSLGAFPRKGSPRRTCGASRDRPFPRERCGAGPVMSNGTGCRHKKHASEEVGGWFREQTRG